MRLDVAVAIEFEREQVMQFVGESPRISARPVRRDLPSGRVDVDIERVGASDIDEFEVDAVAPLVDAAFSMRSSPKNTFNVPMSGTPDSFKVSLEGFANLSMRLNWLLIDSAG
jgi:hypothetical protein